MATDKIKVLFVCLGNICRSPAAEGAFKKAIKDAGLENRFEIDSSGTGNYHIGDLPHTITRSVAKERGIVLDHHARQFKGADFGKFDYIMAMDSTNYHDILMHAVSDEDRSRVFLFREFDPEVDGSPDVPDPYFGGQDGFYKVQDIVERTAGGFLQYLREQHNL